MEHRENYAPSLYIKAGHPANGILGNMKKSGTKFLIAGNWKMNPDTLSEAKALFSSLSRRAAKYRKVSVLVAPPAVFLGTLSRNKSVITLAAQDVSVHQLGAYTGSISARELVSAGAEYSIIGHSERRAAGDDDSAIAQKTIQALEAGMRVILCVGEKERDNNAQYLNVIRDQVLSVVSKIDKAEVKLITIAYEPVWQVGKSYNISISPKDIHEMAIFIKKVVAEAVGNKEGLKTKVLYGGSTHPDNARDILEHGGIDGLLVGRQSLDPEGFSKIIEHAARI
jgi:triosephosphate isomerase